MGYTPGVAQLGGRHSAAKPSMGEGARVLELVENFDANAYRAISEAVSAGRATAQFDATFLTPVRKRDSFRII